MMILVYILFVSYMFIDLIVFFALALYKRKSDSKKHKKSVNTEQFSLDINKSKN